MQLPIVDISVPLYKKFSSVHAVLIKTGIRYEGMLLSNEKNISDNSGFQPKGTLRYGITLTYIRSYSGKFSPSSAGHRLDDQQKMESGRCTSGSAVIEI
jgi:hypothetical protein